MAAQCPNCDQPMVKKDWNRSPGLYCSNCRYHCNPKHWEMLTKHRQPRIEGARLSLVYEPNGTSHSDLLLRIDEWAARSDTYYYAIESSNESAGPEDALRALLRQWRQVVESLSAGDSLLLPHDFSDQCTGWIRISCTGGAVELTPGWSLKEGWSFYPSDFRQAADEVDDFNPIKGVAAKAMTREQALAGIDESLRRLGGS